MDDSKPVKVNLHPDRSKLVPETRRHGWALGWRGCTTIAATVNIEAHISFFVSIFVGSVLGVFPPFSTAPLFGDFIDC